MAVLIERSCVVLPVDAAERIPGGVDVLARAGELCTDGELVRLSVPTLRHLGGLLAALVGGGLRYAPEDAQSELAFVDQRRGPLGWCTWLELARVTHGGGPVLAARHAGDESRDLVTPPGWTYEGSRSAREPVARLALTDRPLVHQGGDEYLDRFTGERLRAGRREPPLDLQLEPLSGASVTVRAEVASGDDLVGLGLMFREALPASAGMLFVFGRDEPRSFWMKNTWVPLDLLFVDRDGVVVGVQERAEPRTLSQRACARPCRYVLEVNGGACAAWGIGVGARVRGLPR